MRLIYALTLSVLCPVLGWSQDLAIAHATIYASPTSPPQAAVTILIHLGRLLGELLPESEVLGLTALMLLQDSRRAARTSSEGDLILLEHQDRSLWNRAQAVEGIALVERALASHHFGPYTLQAAIAAVHAEAASAAETDWRQIVMLYDRMDVGVELIGYNPETGKYVSHFYDSRGNASESEIIVDGNSHLGGVRSELRRSSPRLS